MSKYIVLSFAVISAVRGISIPLAHRDLSTYDSANLEPYADYSTRYQELGCASKHSTQFFDDCCHPMQKGQTLQADRKPYCIPPSSASASTATPTTSAPSEDAAPSAIPVPVNAAASPTYTGHATWFYQHNTAGACGTVHQDSDKVVALDSGIYQGGKYCGKTIQLTNTATGTTTQALVADECPTCDSNYSVDLSQGAFEALTNGDLNEGEFNVSWFFLG